MKRGIVFLFVLLIVILKSNNLYCDEKQDVYLFLARSLFQNGKYSEAVENFKRAEDIGPLKPEDGTLFAISFVKLGRFKNAEDIINRYLKSYGENPFLLLANGILLFEKRNYEKAYESFKKAYEKNKELTQAKLGMVSSLVNMGVKIFDRDKKKAELYFEEALRIEPEYLPALQNLAVIKFNEEKDEEALKYITKILKYDPANIKALELSFYTYYRKKNYNEELKILLRLVTINPKNSEYWAMLGKVYEELGYYKKAIEAFKNARNLNSANPYPYLKLAEYYIKKNNKRKALYIIKEGIGKAVYLIGTLRLSAAQKLQQLGKTPAKSDLEAISRIAKSVEEPRNVLENLLKLLKDVSGDEISYKKELVSLIKRYPHTVELKIKLAEYYMENNDCEDGIAMWRLILIKHPRNIDAYRGLASCYERIGDYERAYKTYKIVLDIDNEDETIYRKIINLAVKLRKVDELCKEWEERLYMDRRNPALLRSLAKLEKMLGRVDKAEIYIKRAKKVEKENKAYLQRQLQKD